MSYPHLSVSKLFTLFPSSPFVPLLLVKLFRPLTYVHQVMNLTTDLQNKRCVLTNVGSICPFAHGQMQEVN